MSPRRAAALLVGGAALLVSGSVWAAATGRTTVPGCRASQLSIAKGPELSPATGQNPLALRLTNHAWSACIVDGYPTVRFTDERGSIPFVIGRGGDQMVTPRRPVPVVIRARRSAFIVLNKYRCDRGDLRLARTLGLGLPGRSPRLSLALPSYPRLGFCGKGDAGSTVVTSPFEPTLAAALRHH